MLRYVTSQISRNKHSSPFKCSINLKKGVPSYDIFLIVFSTNTFKKNCVSILTQKVQINLCVIMFNQNIIYVTYILNQFFYFSNNNLVVTYSQKSINFFSERSRCLFGFLKHFCVSKNDKNDTIFSEHDVTQLRCC